MDHISNFSVSAARDESLRSETRRRRFLRPLAGDRLLKGTRLMVDYVNTLKDNPSGASLPPPATYWSRPS